MLCNFSACLPFSLPLSYISHTPSISALIHAISYGSVCVCQNQYVSHCGLTEENLKWVPSMCPQCICDFCVHQVSPFPPLVIVMFMNTLLLTSEFYLEEILVGFIQYAEQSLKHTETQNALSTMLCVSLLVSYPLYSVPVWFFWPTVWFGKCFEIVLKLNKLINSQIWFTTRNPKSDTATILKWGASRLHSRTLPLFTLKAVLTNIL